MESTLVAPYPVPPNEQERLAALYALEILDTDAEPSFDRIVNMAARLMNAPIALVSLVDRDRQWFKAKCGVAAAETERNFSFCAHAMLGSETLVVCDATKDPRFCGNPLVTGEMSIRFYAGAPLRTRAGLGLGSLCVIDTSVREMPSPAQLDNLEDLAYLVSRQLELRMTDKARRVNEARLNEAQRIAHVGHWEWDLETECGLWSDETYRLFGLAPQSGIDLKRFESLLPPEDRKRVMQAVSNCIQTGEPYAVTHQIVRPNGSVVHVEARGRLERGKLAGTLLDVTARVQADLLLRRSKDELEQRVAQRTALLAGQNQALRKIAEGAPAEQIFEMLPRLAKDDGDLAQDACASLASMVLLRDREQEERKRAEAQRQDALRQAQVLADLAPQMFFTAEADGYVNHYNEKWNTYTGKTSQETLGWKWETVVHPDDFEMVAATWTHAVQSGDPYKVEARLKRASDGMYRWFSGRALPYRNSSGEIVKWFGTLTDIHDQKTENERLEAVVAVRTEQLTRLLTEKETLLKEVHHRVKNNLQIISSLLRMQADRVRDPAAAAALADSRRRVISMALIHEQLYGNQHMNAIDFGEYALQLVNELISSCSWEGRNISSRVEAASVLLRIDQAIPLGLILNELVTNALKYAYPIGTGGEVRIELKARGADVCLSVSDQGVGLPAGWELKNKGSLGLPIVDMLAKQLGGKLNVESGKGARFTVKFPNQAFQAARVVNQAGMVK